MKSVKQNALMHNLLLLLCENETISVSRIAAILDTSESTIRRKIDILNDALKETGYGYIDNPRAGACIWWKTERQSINFSLIMN